METILIVGGGAAGLSAGIYAELNGYHAVICEKQNTVGGCLSYWERQGHHIDNCIHWLIGTNKNTGLYKTWCELGALGDTEIYYKPYLYASHLGDETLSLSRDLDTLERDMLSLSPCDSREIKSFIKAVRTVEGYFGIAGESHDEKYSGWQLIRRLPNLIKYFNLSLEDLANRFHHPLIKDFIVALMPAGFCSLSLIFTAANFCGDNAGLPVGGSEGVAKRLTERFLSLGGMIEYGKEAVAVNSDGGKAISVSFSDGTVIAADHFILTFDPAMIFGKLTDCPMPAALAEQYNKLKRFSAVQCAFECDVTSLTFEGEQTVLIPPEMRYILPGHHVNLRYEDHERGYSPEGKSLLQAMIYCDEASALSYIEAKGRKDGEYADLKKNIAGTMSDLIVKQFPFLDGKLRAIDVWTPATYKRIVGTETGSFMSFAFPKRRIPKEIENEVASFNNLYLAGQWLQMPGGLPIAVNSGKNAILQIVKKHKIK